MKYLLFLILLGIIFSCEKKDTYCWECDKLKYHNNYIGFLDTTFYLCDKTEKEIFQYRMKNTFSNDSLTGEAIVCEKIK